MFRQLFHLIYYKLKSNLKISIDFSLTGVVKNVGSIVLYLIFIIATYFFTYNSIHYLMKKVHIGLFLLHEFLTILLFVFFLSVHIGNVIVSYSTFYKSREVSFLFTQPVSSINIFLVKFFDNFFYSSTTLLLIGFTVIVAYGNYFSMPLGFYLSVLFFVFLPFLLIATSLAAIVLFAVIKLIEIYKFSTVLLTLAIFYVSSLLLYFYFSNPYKVVEDVLKNYPYSVEGIYELNNTIKYLPNYWVSEFLYWSVKGNSRMSLYYALILLLTSTFTFIILYYMANNFYRKSFYIVQNINFGGRNRNNKKKYFNKFILADKQFYVILKKEFLMFFRDPSQWLHLLIMLVFMFIFSISMMNFEQKSKDPFLKTVSYIGVFIFVAFLIASLSLRFIFSSISAEYKNFWKIRASPIKLSKFYNAKLIFYGLPTVLIAIILIIFSHLPFVKDVVLFKYSLISIIVTSIVLVVMNYASGSFFANYSEKSPVRIASTQAASLVFLLSLLYIIIVSVILALIVYNYFNKKSLGLNYEVEYFPLLIIFLISSIIILFSHLIGIKAIQRDFCN